MLLLFMIVDSEKVPLSKGGPEGVVYFWLLNTPRFMISNISIINIPSRGGTLSSPFEGGTDSGLPESRGMTNGTIDFIVLIFLEINILSFTCR